MLKVILRRKGEKPLIDFGEIRGLSGPNSLLRSISEAQAEAIFSDGRRKAFRKGEQIFEQGGEGDSAVLILSGAVKVSMVAATGREIVFAYLSAGELVGEISVLDGQARTASAMAVEKVDSLILSRSELLRRLGEQPDLALAIIRFLCARLRSTNDLLEADRSYENAARLARGILRLMKEHGHRDAQEGRLGITISQSDLGAFVSMARENVSRQISDWGRAGILSVSQGRISVLDVDALEEIGDVYE